MNIPESILSNFAKLTTNSDTKLKEYTFYGTVMLVDLSGNATVKFDGADITTYCESSVPVKENDRVIVTIRDRTAVITSNLTTKTITADYLEAGSARIKGELLGCTGTFSGALTAATGTFAGELQAATGTFSGNLSAAGGTFSGNLSAAGGTFSGNLSAAKGTFAGELQAATGTFKGTLQAGSVKSSTIEGSAIKAGTIDASSTINGASGSFSGAVKFKWNSYTYPTDVYIGATKTETGTTVKSPIWVVAYAFQNKIGSIETHIQPGEVTVNIDRQDDQGIWTSYSSELTPDGVNTSSDRRLKADILDLDADIAMQLRPVEYRLRSERPGSKHYGFIAQEVMDVMPKAVKKNKDGYYGLIYNEMVAPALALAQRDAKKVEELEERIAKLEEMLNVKT